MSAREQVPPPPATVWWVTRDSDLTGQLDQAVDVWTAPPHRFDLEAGAFWMGGGAEGWDLSTRHGRWSLMRAQRVIGTVPDDDRQVIRVERGGLSHSAAEYIQLHWDAEPSWHAVRGHVTAEQALTEFTRWKVDLAGYAGPKYQWAHHVDPEDARFACTVLLSVEPVPGGYPVTAWLKRKVSK